MTPKKLTLTRKNIYTISPSRRILSSMLNPQFLELKREYIFPIIEKKLLELKSTCHTATPLNLGIGDIAKPLSPTVAKAICDATLEMTQNPGLRGYGPHQGYPFLREAIAKEEFANLGICPDEIFISDGINSDVVGILDLFDPSCSIGILDPAYPAYLDGALLSGRTNIHLIPCLEENHFSPLPPNYHLDLIYLCSPSNPTGVAMTKEALAVWIEYAKEESAIILFDHAYSAFVTSANVPKTIFEIPGAQECAIEFHSFSKKAGFTGLRCGYTVIPKTVVSHLNGKAYSLLPLWDRRQSAKSNGVAYPIQKGALAVYSPQGKQETQSQIQEYLQEARKLKEGLQNRGFCCYGGVDSPYLFWKTPGKMSSWEFFDLLLKQCHLISIPGSGFGKAGEGFVRLSSFILPETTTQALERLQHLS